VPRTRHAIYVQPSSPPFFIGDNTTSEWLNMLHARLLAACWLQCAAGERQDRRVQRQMPLNTLEGRAVNI
jgi:hypothetical protein